VSEDDEVNFAVIHNLLLLDAEKKHLWPHKALLKSVLLLLHLLPLPYLAHHSLRMQDLMFDMPHNCVRSQRVLGGAHGAYVAVRMGFPCHS